MRPARTPIILLCVAPLWGVAVTAAVAPNVALQGIQMGRGEDSREAFQTGAITGTIYIKVDKPASGSGLEDKVHFGVVADA